MYLTPLYYNMYKTRHLYTTIPIKPTISGVDPALALMLAHLCMTEYSVAELKV
jgi:hypothetical protein